MILRHTRQAKRYNISPKQDTRLRSDCIQSIWIGIQRQLSQLSSVVYLCQRLEREECNQLGNINFAVTDIEQNTNSVKGAVILKVKIDVSVKIELVEKKIQPTKPCLDKKKIETF